MDFLSLDSSIDSLQVGEDQREGELKGVSGICPPDKGDTEGLTIFSFISSESLDMLG